MNINENKEMIRQYAKHLLTEADINHINKRNRRILQGLNSRKNKIPSAGFRYPAGNKILDALVKIKINLNKNIDFDDSTGGTLQYILNNGSPEGVQDALMQLGIDFNKLETLDADFYSKMMDILGI